MSSKTILFATDLSSRCDRAMDRALTLARESKTTLSVVHAIEDAAHTLHTFTERRIDPKTLAMDRLKHDLGDADDVPLDLTVERGEPVEIVLQRARALNCQLIVTGVARDETLGRSLLGTTVEHLTRRTAIPVLVVKSRPRGPYQKILVGTDFSEGSRRAFEAALSRWPSADFTLFHAFDVAYEGLVDDKDAAREAAYQHALEDCRTFLGDTTEGLLAGREIAVVCEYGDIGLSMQAFVQMHQIDLVVLGTEGRGRIAQMLLGSTAHRLLQFLPTDVLLVRRGES